MNAVNLLQLTDLLLRDVPKDILKLRFLYNCPDRAERTICDKIDNILSSNVFQWPWGTSENNANYTPLYLGVFFRLTRSNSGTTLLRGGGTVRASFSLLRSAKKRQKSPLKESVSANFVPD